MGMLLCGLGVPGHSRAPGDAPLRRPLLLAQRPAPRCGYFLALATRRVVLAVTVLPSTSVTHTVTA